MAQETGLLAKDAEGNSVHQQPDRNRWLRIMDKQAKDPREAVNQGK